MFLYTNSTTQRCQKEIKKIFQIEDVFHLPLVSTTPVVHLELWISPQFFEKIRNGLGETDSCRKPEVPLNLKEIYNISSCGDSSIPFRRTKPGQQEQITGKSCRTEQWTQPAAFIPTPLPVLRRRITKQSVTGLRMPPSILVHLLSSLSPFPTPPPHSFILFAPPPFPV